MHMRLTALCYAAVLLPTSALVVASTSRPAVRARTSAPLLSESASSFETPEEFVEHVQSTLRDQIPGVVHCHVRDCSDGHTATGFVDGTTRALSADGIQLEVLVVSSSFEKVLSIKRHRAVYGCFDDEFKSNAIHSMELKTFTESQWEGMGKPMSYSEVDQSAPPPPKRVQ